MLEVELSKSGPYLFFHFQASFVSLYIIYLTWSAMTNQPDPHCKASLSDLISGSKFFFYFLHSTFLRTKYNKKGIWIPTIWIPETFEYQTFWISDFKWFGIQMVGLSVLSYGACALSLIYVCLDTRTKRSDSNKKPLLKQRKVLRGKSMNEVYIVNPPFKDWTRT